MLFRSTDFFARLLCLRRGQRSNRPAAPAQEPGSDLRSGRRKSRSWKTRSVSGYAGIHVDSRRACAAERRFGYEASTEFPGVGKVLIAVAGTDGNAFAALGAATGKYGCSGLGLHSGQKPVCLRPMAAVRLKCALGHDAALLISLENLCLKASFKYNGFRPKGKA